MRSKVSLILELWMLPVVNGMVASKVLDMEGNTNSSLAGCKPSMPIRRDASCYLYYRSRFDFRVASRLCSALRKNWKWAWKRQVRDDILDLVADFEALDPSKGQKQLKIDIQPVGIGRIKSFADKWIRRLRGLVGSDWQLPGSFDPRRWSAEGLRIDVERVDM